MGSIAEELGAGVNEGRITRHELGQHLTGKGFQPSAISRALGSAVKKWGALSKIEVASGETCYVPCDGAYAALDESFRRPASNRFIFKLRNRFGGMSRYTDSSIPLLVDVIANESSTNCKAKLNAIPFGDREVQVYWQPRNMLSLDLNQAETARVELAQLTNPEQRSIASYENALKNERDLGIIEHIKTQLQQTYDSAARQQPICSIRTPDVEGGRAWSLDGFTVIYILILTIYSAGGLGWFPFLLLRRHLEESEMLPIIQYESKRVQWSGTGFYSE